MQGKRATIAYDFQGATYWLELSADGRDEVERRLAAVLRNGRVLSTPADRSRTRAMHRDVFSTCIAGRMKVSIWHVAAFLIGRDARRIGRR